MWEHPQQSTKYKILKYVFNVIEIHTFELSKIFARKIVKFGPKQSYGISGEQVCESKKSERFLYKHYCDTV